MQDIFLLWAIIGDELGRSIFYGRRCVSLLLYCFEDVYQRRLVINITIYRITQGMLSAEEIYVSEQAVCAYSRVLSGSVNKERNLLTDSCAESGV